MVDDLPFLIQSVVWPVLLLGAWWLGDRLYQRWSVPRPTTYVALGLLAGAWQGPAAGWDWGGLSFIAHVALALVLCELGYRTNLRWFRLNPWVPVTGVLSALVVMAGSWWVTGWFGLATEVRGLVAAVAMAASPAAVVRVVSTVRSTGQVTERVVHLAVIGCLMSAVALKLVAAHWHLSTAGDWLAAAMGSVHHLVGGLVWGGALGALLPRLLGRQPRDRQAATVVLVLVVLLMTAVAHGLKLSPLLAALAFGVVARERRVHLVSAERGFGPVGDLTSVFLFVYVGTLVPWAGVWPSAGLAVALLVVRVVATVGVNTLLARACGVPWRKGAWTGLALAPMSAYAILLLEQTRQQGVLPAGEALLAMAGFVLVLELLGPVWTQHALVAAKETPPALGASRRSP